MKLIPFDPTKATVGKTYTDRLNNKFTYLGMHKTRTYFVNAVDETPVWRRADGSYNFLGVPHSNDIVMVTEPKRRSGPDLFPPGTVVSMSPEKGTWTGVRRVAEKRLVFYGYALAYEQLCEKDYEVFKRSTDGGKTWHPCYVEE